MTSLPLSTLTCLSNRFLRGRPILPGAAFSHNRMESDRG